MAAKYEDRSIGGTPGALPRSRAVTDGSLLADTLPPQPLKELLSAGGANLYVLSGDPGLIDTVQRAGGDQYPVFAVSQWKELETAVFAGRCGIALLDADLVGRNLVDHITALEPHASRVVTLVAAERSVAQDLMGYLSDRRIHRLLIKPATLGITKLLVESAVNRCLQLRELAAESDGFDVLGHSQDGKGVRAWRKVTLGAFVVIGLTAAAAWFWRPEPLGDRVAEPLQVALPASIASDRSVGGESNERFADLMKRGAQAFEAGHLTAPTGDNALDYYLTVLSIDPDEPAAKAKLAAVVDALFAQAESAFLANSFDDAGTALAGVRRADPGSSRLAFLQAQLERATAARAAANASVKRANVARETSSPAAAAATAAPTELDSLLVIASARIARGQLLDPSGDSALEYVRRATDINGSDARVVRSRAALATALLDVARVAVGKDDLGDAARLVGVAKGLGAPSEALTAVELELTGAQQASIEHRHSEWFELASSRLRAGALVEPAGDSALDYLRNLQNEAPGFAGLVDAWDSWTAALGARARQAIATRSWAAGEAAVVAMAAAPRGAAAAAPLREQIETERLQAEYLATASPASELKLLEAPPPVYPPDARRMNVQGWVELEFVVDRIGHPKNAVVVAGEPSGRFDQAALTAIAQYRYAPFEKGQHVYERRVRLRIRFALN